MPRYYHHIRKKDKESDITSEVGDVGLKELNKNMTKKKRISLAYSTVIIALFLLGLYSLLK